MTVETAVEADQEEEAGVEVEVSAETAHHIMGGRQAGRSLWRDCYQIWERKTCGNPILETKHSKEMILFLR